MRTAAIKAVVVLILLGACGRSGGDAGLVTTALDYPVSRFDLRVQLGADQADGLIRQLAARVADVDGVAVAEVDYSGRVIRVGLEPGLSHGDAERVNGAVRAVPGVTSVEAGG